MRVAAALVSSQWTRVMASLWGASMRWEFDHKTHLFADICICICIKDANLFVFVLWPFVLGKMSCVVSLMTQCANSTFKIYFVTYHLEHMSCPIFRVFLYFSSATVPRSRPSLLWLEGHHRGRAWSQGFSFFLTFHEIWLFLLIFPSMCSQTTIQSNSSSPLTEEPSVDSAGFQITWLPMISHFPALSFLYCCLFLSQPRHGDAAALLPAGAPGRHHGADRQHLGRQPLQVDCIMHIPHFFIPTCK